MAPPGTDRHRRPLLLHEVQNGFISVVGMLKGMVFAVVKIIHDHLVNLEPHRVRHRGAIRKETEPIHHTIVCVNFQQNMNLKSSFCLIYVAAPTLQSHPTDVLTKEPVRLAHHGCKGKEKGWNFPKPICPTLICHALPSLKRFVAMLQGHAAIARVWM